MVCMGVWLTILSQGSKIDEPLDPEYGFRERNRMGKNRYTGPIGTRPKPRWAMTPEERRAARKGAKGNGAGDASATLTRGTATAGVGASPSGSKLEIAR